MNKQANPVSSVARDREIKKNFAYFQKIVPTLMDAHEGRFALLRDKEVIAIYDTMGDAMRAGRIFYKDGLYSVQEVRTKPFDLGNFPYVMPLGQSQ